jgi:tRNA A-37 threonylcarbamoyl transferase component Bud32
MNRHSAPEASIDTAGTMDAIALKNAGYGLHAPFTLAMTGADPLTALTVYRHLPGRRITFRARWGNLEAVAKLFFREKEYRRERAGLEALSEAGIPCPRVLCRLVDDGQGAWLLITEYLPQPRGLASLCYEADEATVIGGLREAVALIGRGHRAGLAQRDIHLDNFLATERGLFMVDGGGVEVSGNVSAPDREDNLALFLAQLIPDFDSLIPRLLDAYGDGAPDAASLAERVAVMRERRIRHYQKKSLRTCTEFVAERATGHFAVIRRDCLDSDVAGLVAEPEVAMGGSHMLKPGNTATVVRVGDRVIKRYNIKDWKHFLSRCWRPSRARVSWCNSLRLNYLGIPAPRSLALRENRMGPLRREAYLVSDHVAGPDLLAWVADNREIPAWLDNEIRRLFDVFWAARVSHGDMKATNLIVAGEKLVVLDLDAMAYHPHAGRFKKAHRRDLTRFMANWESGARAHFGQVLADCLARAGIEINTNKGFQ